MHTCHCLTTTHTNLLEKESLEKVLLTCWATILNKSSLIKAVLEDVRKAKLRFVPNENPPPRQVKVTITQFRIVSNSEFELLVEFTASRPDGVAVGTHVYRLGLNGDLTHQETYGVVFQSETVTNSDTNDSMLS